MRATVYVTPMTNWTLGIIGGSGLYQIPGIEGGRWETVTSPWGVPSDQVYRGTLHGVDLVLAGHSHNYERSKFVDGHYGNSSTYSDDGRTYPTH